MATASPAMCLPTVLELASDSSLLSAPLGPELLNLDPAILGGFSELAPTSSVLPCFSPVNWGGGGRPGPGHLTLKFFNGYHLRRSGLELEKCGALGLRGDSSRDSHSLERRETSAYTCHGPSTRAGHLHPKRPRLESASSGWQQATLSTVHI